ncbi:MAG: hypothetical protein HY821_18520 [Acidobacteria bacterium]|nr:hypothetical protein [Acidobacteriota bacterium]
MASRLICVTGRDAGCGKTHFAAALGRFLVSAGHDTAPLHLSAPGSERVSCPGGGSISWPAALLAEGCRLAPAPEFESGWAALPGLLERHEVVLVESPSDPPEEFTAETIRLQRNEWQITINRTSHLPLFQPGLVPMTDPELEALPPWSINSGPRAGILSLPHLANFGDYSLIRGAEWMASPPPGNFGVIFVPSSTNEPSDREWLEENGLWPWLSAQAAKGAVIVTCGWSQLSAATAAVAVNPGALTDYRLVSKVLKRKLAAPLPPEYVLDELAAWASGWDGLALLDTHLR